MRVAIIVSRFPRASETYIKTEAEALALQHDVTVLSRLPADVPYATDLPHRLAPLSMLARRAVLDLRPDVLHTHWLTMVPFVAGVSRSTGIPFTVRSHSFDVLGPFGDERVSLRFRRIVRLINEENCRGVLVFPPLKERLLLAGVREEKVQVCMPVVNVQRFHDRGPNGESIMNVGACLPKKGVSDFIELAAELPGPEYRLYAVGKLGRQDARRNESLGNPVTVMDPVHPNDMPREYKKHRWLVYTACPRLATVGWPMAVAEAQASGVGVCMANIRPDLKDWIGNAGYLFDSRSELHDILAGPFPEEKRALGFELAGRSDIQTHLKLLTGLWD